MRTGGSIQAIRSHGLQAADGSIFLSDHIFAQRDHALAECMLGPSRDRSGREAAFQDDAVPAQHPVKRHAGNP
jgi:hypothetical protein